MDDRLDVLVIGDIDRQRLPPEDSGRYGHLVPRTELPAGKYLSCPIDVPPDAGGQTRAMLLRNRLFVREAGISPSVLSFNARTDLDQRRQSMLERGLLVEEIATPNIYEHYREHGWGNDVEAVGEPASLTSYKKDEQTFPDGSPWRIVYQGPDGRPALFDYLRADGSPYLRIPNFIFAEPETWPSKIQQIGADGAVVGEFASVGQWFRRWVRELSEGQRTFVFVDSRHNAPHVIPLRAPHLHVVYVLHNIHLRAPRLWSSELPPMYRRVFGRINDMDAMVSLTQRQRDDIALRRGNTTNLFVVPNPVEVPQAGDREPRDPHLVAIVARLEAQKRIGHALRAFQLVRREVPTARLDIYGDGSKRERLQSTIDGLGLSDAVTLKGHDPHAREALWQASAFLVTSSFEGWNLALQESMSHGCPVVSYDIKYGPQEQITDGTDGFLVADGDTGAMAERVIRLLRSPELVAEMGAAGMEKTRSSASRFVQTWQHVLQSVVDLGPRRTILKKVTLDVQELRFVGGRSSRRLVQRSRSFIPSAADEHDMLKFHGTLHVEGRSSVSDLDSAQITLAAVHHPTGYVAELPVSVQRQGESFLVSSSFSAAEALAGAPPAADLGLRLRLVWENAAWQTDVQRPYDAPGPGVEMFFDVNETLRLRPRRA